MSHLVDLPTGKPCIVVSDGYTFLAVADHDDPDFTLTPMERAAFSARLRALADMLDRSAPTTGMGC